MRQLFVAFLGVSLAACTSKPTPDAGAVFGTWSTTESAGKYGGQLYGYSGDPARGEWLAVLDTAGPDGGAIPDRLAASITFDGGLLMRETVVYPPGNLTYASCTEVSTWSGAATHQRADSGEGLTLSGSGPGVTNRAGCAKPSDDGTATPTTAIFGTYALSSVQHTGGGGLSGGTAYYGLFLTAGANAEPTWAFQSRTDDTASLTLSRDQTWTKTFTRKYPQDTLRYAGCVETLQQAGTFTHTATADFPTTAGDITFTATMPGTLTRASCAADVDNGTSSIDATTALGPMSGTHGWGIYTVDGIGPGVGIAIGFESAYIGTVLAHQ